MPPTYAEKDNFMCGRIYTIKQKIRANKKGRRKKNNASQPLKRGENKKV